MREKEKFIFNWIQTQIYSININESFFILGITKKVGENNDDDNIYQKK